MAWAQKVKGGGSFNQHHQGADLDDAHFPTLGKTAPSPKSAPPGGTTGRAWCPQAKARKAKQQAEAEKFAALLDREEEENSRAEAAVAMEEELRTRAAIEEFGSKWAERLNKDRPLTVEDLDVMNMTPEEVLKTAMGFFE